MQEMNEELDSKLIELYSEWYAYCLEGGHEPTQTDFVNCVRNRLAQLSEEDNSKISY